MAPDNEKVFVAKLPDQPTEGMIVYHYIGGDETTTPLKLTFVDGRWCLLKDEES